MDDEEKEPNLDPLLQLVKSYGAAGITGALDILGKIVEAIGRVAEGIATNADPAGQLISLALAGLTIQFFLTTEPYKSALHKLKLDALMENWYNFMLHEVPDLFSKIPGLGGSTTNLGLPGPPTIPTTTATPVPKPDAKAPFWYVWKFSFIGLWQKVFYADLGQATRDFDVWNVLGICGNLVQVVVDYRLTGTIANGSWEPFSIITIIKASTAHPDIGPQDPRL